MMTYSGPQIDDPDILGRLPQYLQELLKQRNGFIMLDGALHLRGACKAPVWHSLREAWQGEMAFHKHYAEINANDVPFAQDCVGDQFLLRGDEVIRLYAEDGRVESLGMQLDAFLSAAESDPIRFLGMQPLLQFADGGETLNPGQLLMVYPPFCTVESASGVHISAVPAEELLSFHVQFYTQIAGLDNGDRIEIELD